MTNDNLVLLARPSSLLVENMKKLMSEAHCLPTPISTIEALEDYEESEIKAIVVSTALSSVVQIHYPVVVGVARVQFPQAPIFLASYANIERSKKIIQSKLSEADIPYELLSIEEASKKNQIDFKHQIIIITRDDLEDKLMYPQTLKTNSQILHGSPINA